MNTLLWRNALSTKPTTSPWRRWVLLMLGGLSAGCTSTVITPVYYATPRPVAIDAGLQACVDHAAKAQKAAFPQNFNMMTFKTGGLVAMPFGQKVGNQPVEKIYDGMGAWYGTSEYRLVRFHCLLGKDNKALYTFTRPE